MSEQRWCHIFFSSTLISSQDVLCMWLSWQINGKRKVSVNFREVLPSVPRPGLWQIEEGCFDRFCIPYRPSLFAEAIESVAFTWDHRWGKRNTSLAELEVIVVHSGGIWTRQHHYKPFNGITNRVFTILSNTAISYVGVMVSLEWIPFLWLCFRQILCRAIKYSKNRNAH